MSRPIPKDAARTRSRRWMRRLLTGLAVALLAAGGWFGFWRYHLKRFAEVRPGVLYRCAQPTEFGFRQAIKQHQIKTVLSVRLEDPPLYRGLLDPGEPDGELESRYVPRLGLRHVQWPLGEETYWPWLTPWQLEAFYKLLDDPRNHPVLVHCLGGRHRTGNFTALFQMEYNRRSAEQAIAEMLSYDFGPIAWVQDHNLRTYLPRPRPNPAQWQVLVQEFFSGQSNVPADYEQLVRRLKASAEDSRLGGRLLAYVTTDGPFALPLAQRLIETPDQPLAATAARVADRMLKTSEDPQTLAAAAALVADYGTPEQQQALLERLRDEPKRGHASGHYEAIVAGVTNRYTPNRLAYLPPLLEDVRERPGVNTIGRRYCDTAVARLVSITNEPLFVDGPSVLQAWNDARRRSQQWFEHHPGAHQLSTLLPPIGNNVVRTVGRVEIDGHNVPR